jgi:membrane associated rhomboid family serine protease
MTLRIVIFTVLTSIICFYNHQMMERFIFNPWLVAHRRQWYRMITSGLIHADWIHLGINMLVLFSFGLSVERHYEFLFGERGDYLYVLMYVSALAFSLLPSYVKHRENYHYNALGASGAVAAVLFAAILFKPLAPIYLFGIIKLPGILVGAGYLLYEYQASRRQDSLINHDAHFWGALYGIAFTIALYPPVVAHFFKQLTSF